MEGLVLGSKKPARGVRVERALWNLVEGNLVRRTGYSRQHAGRMVMVAVMEKRDTHVVQRRREADCCQTVVSAFDISEAAA
jgi:hypothetical protein